MGEADHEYQQWEMINASVPAETLDRELVARKIIETSRTLAAGYRGAFGAFSTEAEQTSAATCAMVANNTGFFILQSLGFSGKEIRELCEKYPRPEM